MEIQTKNTFPFFSISLSRGPEKSTQLDRDDFRPFYTHTYNGEKNLGEMGEAKNYRLDFQMLRVRSWQAWIESEVAQTIIGRFIIWKIGSGLKFQSEPMIDILQAEGITIDRQALSKAVESRWELYRESTDCDYSGMETLDDLASIAEKNSMIGGDVLVVMRYENNNPTIQLIDGAHIQSPFMDSAVFPQTLPNGNRVIDGIEVDARKKHIAYWVRTGIGMEYERIPVFGKETGIKMAFLVYGLKYRIDTMRGVPLLSVVLETVKKMERYKEATVGGAEERAKVAYQVVHGKTSTGENPLDKRLAMASGFGTEKDQLPNDAAGKAVAREVAVTTNKQAFNMPVDSELKILNAPTGELNYKDFYSTNRDALCSTVNIPPNVAMSQYHDSFSASRAALKDWEHTLNVGRKKFAKSFYQPIFNFFFYIQVLQNKISAPGYLAAMLSGNNYVINAYQRSRWIGAQVPHIDPLKEVKAEREKLGSAGLALPLTTVEAAIESLTGADSTEVMEQFRDELAESIEFKIVAPVAVGNSDKPKESGSAED